ncbi:MAG TPA: MT-A70 family methyltransferase, partial [Blastocatellia bacterium]|nr:MT-A70 family methyltransferase [Blastocatellia bacterium]
MKRYGIILSDCPWPYDNNRSGRVKDGAYTYPAMSIAELCQLPVGDLAAKDCALFMWATMPKLEEALAVIRAWGFRYTTCAFVWIKQNPKSGGIYSGLGHWT